MAKKPQAKRSSRDKYALNLWSNFIRDRAGRRCERCGTGEEQLLSMGWSLQGAHIEGRRKRSVRYHPDNGIALCAGPGKYGGCHGWFDNHCSAKERLDFVYEKRGASLDVVFDLVKERWDRDIDRAIVDIKAASRSLSVGSSSGVAA